MNVESSMTCDKKNKLIMVLVLSHVLQMVSKQVVSFDK